MALRTTGYKHVVSTSAPADVSIGDEWFDPSSNRLYKFMVTTGNISPTWNELYTSISGAGITFPYWTTASRPSNPTNGTTGYNISLIALEMYVNGNWSVILGTGYLLDYIVIGGGGGGGGGNNWGGGGGGGGMLTGSTTVHGGTSYSITIGAGGSGSSSGVARGNNGNNSVFVLSSNVISVIGGGGGGSWNGTINYPRTASTSIQNGSSGASGGGACSKGSLSAAGTVGQGNAGGTGASNNSSFDGAGGGGGRGGIGGNGGNNFGGVGGVGLASTIIPIIPNYSILFNGTSQYLTVAANTALDFGTGDFTVECWVYPTSIAAAYPTFLGSVTGWSAGASGHRYNNAGYANKFTFHLNGAGDPFMSSSGTFSFNTWYHYALTRSGNTWNMYVNGVLQSTQTSAIAYNPSLGGLRIGWASWDAGNGYFAGNLSNMRLVKGVAVYTSNFAVPTPPLTAITNTSLLTAQSNTIVDNSTNTVTITSIDSPTVSSSVIPTTYYAGGGGGGASGTQGVGGYGGGGSAAIPGIAGSSNTGGGGGGLGNAGSSSGGAGGSGIVIIAYQNATKRGSGGTVTSYTIAEGLTQWVHTFTSSGIYTA